MESVKIDGNHLTIEEIIAVARNGAYVELAPEAKVAINQSRSWVGNYPIRQASVRDQHWIWSFF